jgi:hypothetical protein
MKSDQLLLGLLVNTFFKCFSDSRSLIRISSSSDDEGRHSADSEEASESIVENDLTTSVRSHVKLQIDSNYVSSRASRLSYT